MKDQRNIESLLMWETDIARVRDEIVRSYIKAEEDAVIRALKAYLKRELTTEDFKLCTKLIDTRYTDRYVLNYNGQSIGWIVEAPTLPNKVTPWIH